jgi:hypothetical protein
MIGEAGDSSAKAITPTTITASAIAACPAREPSGGDC